MKSLRYGSLKFFVNHYDLALPAGWGDVFRRKAPLEVEIGFGTGEYLVRTAAASPAHDFIGIEENVERIHKTLRKLEAAKIGNVRLLHVDARLAMERLFSPRSITRIHCLFPCPWPNKNQVKHRLFAHDFIKLLNNRLISGGKIDLVTDHDEYAAWAKVQSARTGFKVEFDIIRPRFDTKFERKWREAGQEEFFALAFTKTKHVLRRAGKEQKLKVYFFDHFNPASFHFEDVKGNPSVIFKEFFFDERRRQGMVHLLVAEEYLQQHLWAKIVKTTQKGWCLAVADGSLLIPTSGVVKALERLYQFLSRS
jgi:tRNA (guanine-N7-)-methyltransferase